MMKYISLYRIMYGCDIDNNCAFSSILVLNTIGYFWQHSHDYRDQRVWKYRINIVAESKKNLAAWEISRNKQVRSWERTLKIIKIHHKLLIINHHSIYMYVCIAKHGFLRKVFLNNRDTQQRHVRTTKSNKQVTSNKHKNSMNKMRKSRNRE